MKIADEIVNIDRIVDSISEELAVLVRHNVLDMREAIEINLRISNKTYNWLSDKLNPDDLLSFVIQKGNSKGGVMENQLLH